MKTVITSTENNPSALFDKRFGRASWFCVYDDEAPSVKFYENAHANDGNGAGTKAAEQMVELGVTKVISGDFGPKAKDLLEKFNIQMVVLQDDDLTTGSIIEKLKR